MGRAADEAKKSTAAPISCGSWKPNGVFRVAGPSLIGPLALIAPGVMTAPGRTVLTVIECSASSNALARLSAASAPLDDAYETRPLMRPPRSAFDAMLTILPPCWE